MSFIKKIHTITAAKNSDKLVAELVDTLGSKAVLQILADVLKANVASLKSPHPDEKDAKGKRGLEKTRKAITHDIKLIESIISKIEGDDTVYAAGFIPA